VKTFTIGQLEIEVRRHVRVDGSRFPTPDPTQVGDYFVIVARWQGNPVDFYPYEGRRNDPLAFGFVGAKVLPVYAPFNPDTQTEITTEQSLERQRLGQPVEYRQTGIKRGGDFRSRFFRIIARRLGKAILARQLVKRVQDITDEDEKAAGLVVRRLLIADFVEPEQLRVMTIDGAARFLRDVDGDLEEGNRPPGTIVSIDADFDSHTTSSTQDETGTSLQVSTDGIGSELRRVQLSFPLTSIPNGADINDSDLQFNVSSEDVESPEGVIVCLYNGTGGTDPNSDTAANKYARSTGSTLVTIDCSSTGSKTGDLGLSADIVIETNLGGVDFVSFGLRHSAFDASEEVFIESIEAPGTDPPTLTVDYTIPTQTISGAGGIEAPNSGGGGVQTPEFDIGNWHYLTDTNTMTFAHIVGNQTNRILIVDVGSRGGQSVSGITFNGDALTKRVHVQPGGDVRLERWYLINPDIGLHDIIISMGSVQSFGAGSHSWYNVDQTTPFGTDATGSGSGATDGTAVVDTPDATDIAVVGIGDQSGGSDATPDGTESHRVNMDGTHSDLDVFSKPRTGATTQLDWTYPGSEFWAYIGNALKGATVPAGDVFGTPAILPSQFVQPSGIASPHAYDSFNRANAAAGVSDSGHPWTGTGGVSNIVSNTLRIAQADDAIVDIGNRSVVVEYTVTQLGAFGGGFPTPALNVSTGASQYTYLRRTAGTWEAVDAWSGDSFAIGAGPALAVSDKVRVAFVGSAGATLYLWINGVYIGNTGNVLTLWTNGTRHGVRNGSSHASDIVGIDDFSATAFGLPTMGWNLDPTGIVTAEAFGATSLNQGLVVAPSSVASLEAFGTTVFGRGPVSISPSGIASLQAFGTHVLARGAVAVIPSGIASQEAVGAFHAVGSFVGVFPPAIDSAEAFGSHVLAPGPILIHISTGTNYALNSSFELPMSTVDPGRAVAANFIYNGSGVITQQSDDKATGRRAMKVDCIDFRLYGVMVQVEVPSTGIYTISYARKALNHTSNGNGGMTLQLAQGTAVYTQISSIGTPYGTNLGTHDWQRHGRVINVTTPGLVNIFLTPCYAAAVSANSSGTLWYDDVMVEPGTTDAQNHVMTLDAPVVDAIGGIQTAEALGSPMFGHIIKQDTNLLRHYHAEDGILFPVPNGAPMPVIDIVDTDSVSGNKAFRMTAQGAASQRLVYSWAISAPTAGKKYSVSGWFKTLSPSAVGDSVTNVMWETGGASGNQSMGVPNVISPSKQWSLSWQYFEIHGSTVLQNDRSTLQFYFGNLNAQAGEIYLMDDVKIWEHKAAGGGSIASDETPGRHALTVGAVSILPAGIVSAEAFGTTRIASLVSVSGITSQEAFGTPSVLLKIVAQAIASAEAFGTHAFVPGPVSISPTGIVSLEAFGTPKLNLTIFPVGINSAEAFGNHRVIAVLFDEGRVAIIVYNSSGIPTGTVYPIEANHTDRLDKLTTFDFTIPATAAGAELLEGGKEIGIFYEGEGEVFRGKIGRRRIEDR